MLFNIDFYYCYFKQNRCNNIYLAFSMLGVVYMAIILFQFEFEVFLVLRRRGCFLGYVGRVSAGGMDRFRDFVRWRVLGSFLVWFRRGYKGLLRQNKKGICIFKNKRCGLFLRVRKFEFFRLDKGIDVNVYCKELLLGCLDKGIVEWGDMCNQRFKMQ